ncbi:MAG: hypothetical protein JKY65_07925 [Planctomycetes bacterium]|nr:hypothetical protein [Planctomycetota bacterium]
MNTLSEGATVREVAGMTLGTLLTMTRSGGGRGGTNVRGNLACLLFQARLHQLDWEARAGLEPSAPEPTAGRIVVKRRPS